MIKKSILKATGGFNPEYCRASGEDTDLSYKIIKAGYKIYFAKDAFVSHKNILKFWKYIVAQFRHGYWRMKLYKGNSSMIIRDGYACWKDFLETSLVLMLFFFLSFNSQDTVTLFYILIAMLFLIQLPQAIMIGFQGRNLLYLGFAFVTFIRAFIRTVGGIFGFIKFWILRMG
jgi:GT2 family glycosyltransferase